MKHTIAMHCGSHDDGGYISGTAASLSHNTLEVCKLWSAKTSCCIPPFCAFPTGPCILSNCIRTLGDVVEGISVLIEKRIHKAKFFISARCGKAFFIQERDDGSPRRCRSRRASNCHFFQTPKRAARVNLKLLTQQRHIWRTTAIRGITVLAGFRIFCQICLHGGGLVRWHVVV